MKIKPRMSSEITVRISLDFQDSPEIHTLLAMTPVRERRALIRTALEQFIKETRHPAGDVDHQILQISEWLRERKGSETVEVQVENSTSNIKNLEKGTPKDKLPVVFNNGSPSVPDRINSSISINEEQSSVSATRWLSG